jgi:hypothetical protein
MRSITSSYFRGSVFLLLGVMLLVWGVAVRGITDSEAPFYFFLVFAMAMGVLGLVEMAPTYNPPVRGENEPAEPDEQDRFLKFFQERWAKGTLLGFFLGEQQTESSDALSRCYQLEKALARQVKEHAGSAGFEDHKGRLEEIAARREENAGKLASRLRALDAEIPEVDATQKDDSSNWGRMKLDYEDLQALNILYAEVSVNIDSDETGKLLAEVSAQSASDEWAIMGLIARTDPFAVD